MDKLPGNVFIILQNITNYNTCWKPFSKKHMGD